MVNALKKTSGRFGKKPTNSVLRTTATTLAVTLSCSVFGIFAASAPAQASVYGDRLVTTIGTWGAAPGFGPENARGQVRTGGDLPNVLFEIPAIDKTGPITYSDAHRARTYCLAADQTTAGVELAWVEVGAGKCENVKTVRRGKLNQFGFVGAVGSNWGKKLGVLPGGDGIGWTGNQQYFKIESVTDPKVVTIQGPTAASLSRSPEIFGRGTVRATIQVWNSSTGVMLGTTTVRDDGYWFFDAGIVFTAGQSVSITAKQVARYSVKASEASTTFTVSLPVTMQVRSMNLKTKQAVVSGTATPNSKVHVRASSTGDEAFVLTDANGAWRDQTFSNLPLGRTTFTAVQYIDNVNPVQGGSASVGVNLEAPVEPAKPVEPVKPAEPAKPVEEAEQAEPVAPVEPSAPLLPSTPVKSETTPVESFDHKPGEVTEEVPGGADSAIEAVTDDAVTQEPLGPSAKVAEDTRREEARLAALAELEQQRRAAEAAARESEAKLAVERLKLEQQLELERKLADGAAAAQVEGQSEAESTTEEVVSPAATSQPEGEAAVAVAVEGTVVEVAAEPEPEANTDPGVVSESPDAAVSIAEAEQEVAAAQREVEAQQVELEAAQRELEELAAAEESQRAEAELRLNAPQQEMAQPAADPEAVAESVPTLPTVPEVETSATAESAPELKMSLVEGAHAGAANTIAVLGGIVSAPSVSGFPSALVADAAASSADVRRQVAVPVPLAAPESPIAVKAPVKLISADKAAAIKRLKASEDVSMSGLFALGLGLLAAAGAAAGSRQIRRRRRGVPSAEAALSE